MARGGGIAPDPRRQMKKRLLVLIPSVALAGLLLAVASLLLFDPLTPRRRLADGRTLYLDAALFGGQSQRWIAGPAWRRAVGTLLPDPLLTRWSWRFERLESQPGMLTFWVRLNRPPHSSRVLYRAEIFDELGHTVSCPVLPFYYDGSGDPVQIFARAFPRRGKMVGLRVWSAGPDGAWAACPAFWIRNPDPGPHPIWTPDRLPVSRRVGETTVTLGQLWLTPHPDDGGDAGVVSRDLIAVLRVTGDPQPPGVWNPVRLELRDATGNRYETMNYREQPGPWSPLARGAPRPSVPAGDWRSFWGRTPALVTGEVLRAHVTLARNREARYREDELWTVRDIPLLRTTMRRWAFVAEARRAGERVRVTGIRGPYPLHRKSDYNASLAVATRGRRVLALRATDDRGRPVAVAGHSESGGWPISLRVPPGAKRVNVTFAIQKPVEVDFTLPAP